MGSKKIFYAAPAHVCHRNVYFLWCTRTSAPHNVLFLWCIGTSAPQNALFLWRTRLVRHRNSETNDWGWQDVGPTVFLWLMRAWCATKISYFLWRTISGAPFCRGRKTSAPQNSIPSIALFVLVKY
jgi:hypothetical protein